MTPEKCPQCGARVINREATNCWLCGASFTEGESANVEPPPFSEGITENLPPQRRFPRTHEELATDNPVIAIVGLLLLFLAFGLAQADAGGIAIVLIVVTLPALGRVAYFTAKRNATGKRPLTGGEYVLFFFTSLGVVTMIGVASSAAFFATCFAICLGGLSLNSLNQGRGTGEWVLISSVGGGLIVGIVVLVLTVRYLWVRKV